MENILEKFLENYFCAVPKEKIAKYLKQFFEEEKEKEEFSEELNSLKLELNKYKCNFNVKFEGHVVFTAYTNCEIDDYGFNVPICTSYHFEPCCLGISYLANSLKKSQIQEMTNDLEALQHLPDDETLEVWKIDNRSNTTEKNLIALRDKTRQLCFSFAQKWNCNLELSFK